MTMSSFMENLSPKVALALVSFFLGQLGDGLNIFQVSCEYDSAMGGQSLVLSAHSMPS
jgi:hypothetical protein